MVHFRYEQWLGEIRDRFSNYRKLRNLIHTIKILCEEGKLRNCDVLLTYNIVADYAYYKGSSSSKLLLFELVLRLRKVQMTGYLIIHVIHMVGTRI